MTPKTLAVTTGGAQPKVTVADTTAKTNTQTGTSKGTPAGSKPGTGSPSFADAGKSIANAVHSVVSGGAQSGSTGHGGSMGGGIR